MSYGDFNSADELLAALDNDLAVIDEIILSYEMEIRANEEIAAAERAAALLA